MTAEAVHTAERWDCRDRKRRLRMRVDSRSVFTIERLQAERARGLRAIAPAAAPSRRRRA